MIVIIDYGMGNVGSIVNMLKALNKESVVSADPELIKKADQLILPGVGAFDKGMKSLNEKGLSELLIELSSVKRIPLLGICLGMQLLTRGSEEGKLPGLGLVDAYTHHFKGISPSFDHRVPHMGWNEVAFCADNLIELNELPGPNKYYFVHSYFVKCANEGDILMKAFYGDWFTAAFQKENIVGFQFHPEKSHKYGMKLLNKFIRS